MSLNLKLSSSYQIQNFKNKKNALDWYKAWGGTSKLAEADALLSSIDTTPRAIEHSIRLLSYQNLNHK